MHYFESGYCVREPAWHGLADVHEDYPENWDQAREWAGLTWDPIADPLWARRLSAPQLAEGIERLITTTRATRPATIARQVADLVEGSLQSVEGFQRIVKSDDFAATLGTTKERYTPITHGDYGRIIEAVLDQPGVKYETAGSVEGGACTWALAFLDEPVTLGAELASRGVQDSSLTLPYLVLTARHDGDGAARLQSTSVRVVCANTVRACEAEADRNGTVFSFRHTAGWEDRIEEARRAIKGVRTEFAAYCAWANDMLDIPVSDKQARQFITEFIPMEPGITDRAARNVEEARLAVTGILNGKTSAGIEGTAFWLVQAGAEWLDHYRATRNPESLFRRAIMQPSKAKVQMVEIVRHVIAA
jgi:phage/plasmid-like protein (TIGR03299 family)